LARAVLCTDRDDRDHLLQAEVRQPAPHLDMPCRTVSSPTISEFDQGSAKRLYYTFPFRFFQKVLRQPFKPPLALPMIRATNC
jgi:hypothetical protein